MALNYLETGRTNGETARNSDSDLPAGSEPPLTGLHTGLKEKYPPGYCGPVALSRVLGLLGLPITPPEVAAMAQWTPGWGTTHEGLVYAASQPEVTAKAVADLDIMELQKLRVQGHHIIVNYIDRGYGTPQYTLKYDPHEDGHYAIFTGLKKDPGSRDPLVGLRCNYRNYYTEPIREFVDHWFDYLPNNKKSSRWALIITSIVAGLPDQSHPPALEKPASSASVVEQNHRSPE